MKLSVLIKMSGIASVLCLAGCASSSIIRNTPLTLSHASSMLVIPFVNNSDSAAAGDRAANMVAGILQVRGIERVTVYHFKQSCDPIKSCESNRRLTPRIARWAMSHGYHYIVTGNVSEWRYKIGLDGEPSVGATVTIKDISSGARLWTAVGSRTGHSWSGLSTTAQKMFQQILSNFRVQ